MYQQAFKETVGKGKYFNEIVEGTKPKKEHLHLKPMVYTLYLIKCRNTLKAAIAVICFKYLISWADQVCEHKNILHKKTNLFSLSRSPPALCST